MRIAMISIHSSPMGRLGTRDTGGMSIYVRVLASELGRRGHHVDIFTRRSGENRQLPPVMAPYPLVRLVHLDAHGAEAVTKNELYPHLNIYTAALEEFRRTERIQYDIIHSNYWLSGYMGRQLQCRWQRPHVMTFHTLGAVKQSVHPGSPEPPQRIISEKELARTCDRLLAPTAGEAHHLVSHYNADPDRIGIVPCGVDFSSFHPMEKTRCRHRLGFVDEDKLALFVGRFDPMKGLEKFIVSIVYLKNHPGFKAVIVGGDGEMSPERERGRRLARRLMVDDRLVFTGRIEHESMPLYYNAADVVAVPSRYESFGLVALEALACGTPVVAAPVGIMAHIISPEKNGGLVRDGSPEGLARELERFLAEPDRLRTDEIRASIASFSWSEVASTLLREYTSVLIPYNISSSYPESSSCRNPR